METQVSKIEPESGKSPQAIIWIAGIALTLFCAVGIAAVMGWIPSSVGGSSDKAAIESQSAVKAPAAAKSSGAAKTHVANATATPPVPVPVQVAAAVKCAECGVIESVREIDAKGSGSGLGAVGGAVVGGLLGNQVGGGRGQDVLTVVGAVGGAVAGNEVEKRVKTTKSWEVTVRLYDGSSRVISQAHQPTWRTGDKVKVVNGAIQSNV